MKSENPSRRRFITIAAASAAVPLANALLAGNAAAQAAVSPTSPQATALNFVLDASTSKVRTNAASRCDNCNLYTAKGPKEGGCSIFAGGLVPAMGWCSAWVQTQK